MNYLVFPTLPGRSWPLTREDRWSTLVQQSAGMKEVRIGLVSYPLHVWTLRYEYLLSRNNYRTFQKVPSVGALWQFNIAIGSDLRALMGLYNAVGGTRDPFLFSDPTDQSIAMEQIGVGDGVTTDFQLVRSYGPFSSVEPIFNPSGTGVSAVHWTAGTSYGRGWNILPSIYSTGAYQSCHAWRVRESGTSGTVEPLWMAHLGSSVSDGSLNYDDQGPAFALFYEGAPVLPTIYTVSPTGLVRFAVAPAVGKLLNWSGEFQFLCRFLADTGVEFDNIMSGIWSQNGIKFTSIKQ